MILYHVLVPSDSRRSKSDYGVEWEGGDIPQQPPPLSLTSSPLYCRWEILCPRRCFLGVLGQRGSQHCGCGVPGVKYQVSFWYPTGSILSGQHSSGLGELKAVESELAADPKSKYMSAEVPG